MADSGMQINETKPEPAPLSVHGVHLIRTAQVNTLALSQMADGKANILMGATFVVFSLVITKSFAEEIKWSMILLAVTAFASAICAVLAITPPLRAKAVPEGQFNPLFFGHFSLRDEQVWADDLITHLDKDEKVYRLMMRDLYQNGLVLHRRKYRYLAAAYRLFLGGLGLTLAIYLLETAV
jgi:hypothetical protein